MSQTKDDESWHMPDFSLQTYFCLVCLQYDVHVIPSVFINPSRNYFWIYNHCMTGVTQVWFMNSVSCLNSEWIMNFKFCDRQQHIWCYIEFAMLHFTQITRKSYILPTWHFAKPSFLPKQPRKTYNLPLFYHIPIQIAKTFI